MKDKLQALVNYTWSHAIDEVSEGLQLRVLERGNASFDVRHNLSASVHYALPSPKFGGPIGFLLRDWSADVIVHAQSGLPWDPRTLAGTSVVIDGIQQFVRPDLVPNVPIIIDDPNQPGGRRHNPAAFRLPSSCLFPPGGTTCVNVVVRQGNLGRNVLRAFPIYQADISLGRTFRLRENLNLKLKGDAFNVFNHPMFGQPTGDFTQSSFGTTSQTLNRGLGGSGLSSIYQMGGPRSIQLSARVEF